MKPEPNKPAVKRAFYPKTKRDEPGIAELIRALQQINVSDPQSSLNATTISDNNGGRIEL